MTTSTLTHNNVTIYHNPSCSNSRGALAILQEHGITPTVVEYLKTPLDATGLRDLVKQLSVPVRAILRQKGEVYDALDLANPKWSDEELLGFIAQHPALMQRPVVLTEKGAKICRPPEEVLGLLRS